MPMASRSSRNLDCRLEKKSYSRWRLAPMQVSTMMRRRPALMANPWKLTSSSPAGVAWWGCSHGYASIIAGVPPSSSIESGSSRFHTSTMRLTSTLPMRQVLMCSKAMGSIASYCVYTTGAIEQKICCPFGHHDGRSVGVTAHDGREDRRVGDAQRVQADDAQRWIHHRGRISTHPAGADRVMNGGGGGAYEFGDLIGGAHVGTGRQLGGTVAGKRCCAEDPAA